MDADCSNDVGGVQDRGFLLGMRGVLMNKNVIALLSIPTFSSLFLASALLLNGAYMETVTFLLITLPWIIGFVGYSILRRCRNGLDGT